VLERIGGEVAHSEVVAGGVEVAFKTVLVFALFAAQLAEMF
jgi:hypothetical protein